MHWPKMQSSQSSFSARSSISLLGLFPVGCFSFCSVDLIIGPSWSGTCLQNITKLCAVGWSLYLYFYGGIREQFVCVVLWRHNWLSSSSGACKCIARSFGFQKCNFWALCKSVLPTGAFVRDSSTICVWRLPYESDPKRWALEHWMHWM